MAQQQVGEPVGFGLGVVLVAEAGFMGKGVVLQPVQQLGTVAGDHPQLRHMHMGVDKARQNQRVGKMLDRGSRWQ